MLASRVDDVAVILAKGLTVVVVAVAALGLTSCTAGGAPEPTNSGVDLNQHFAAFEVCDDLPAPYLCATIEVPLDRHDDGAGMIPLRIFGIPHADMSTPEGLPLFTTPGGPGAEGIDNHALWQLPGLIGANHDVVTIDPRGTGMSAAIDCPELQGGSTTAAQFYQDSTACGQQVGPTSDLFGGPHRAMDIEAVREFMGYDRIIFHGNSYGGIDVQAYASRFPDRLAAAVIDGGWVMDDIDMFFGTGYPASLMGVVDTACRADAACAASTADPSGTVSTVVARLREGPVVEDGTVVIDEASIARLIRDAGAAVEVVAASLPFLAGDTTPMANLVREHQAIGIPPGGEVEAFSAGANAAGWCNDQVFPFDVTASQADRQSQLDDALAALDDDAFAPWSKEGWQSMWLFGQCVGWPNPSQHEPVLVGDPSFPGIPTLLLVGDQDPALASAATLEGRFPAGTTVVVPGAQHPSMSLGACIAAFEAEFIETLEVPDTPPCGDH